MRKLDVAIWAKAHNRFLNTKQLVHMQSKYLASRNMQIEYPSQPSGKDDLVYLCMAEIM